MTLSGGAKLAGVMGWPVKHSKSPKLQGYWLDKYAIDAAYVPLPVAPDDFESVFRTLPKMGFAGVNVTVPHKETAFGLCTDLSERARQMGAVNTVVFRADGSIFGDNTDGYGFLESLRSSAPSWDATSGPAVVLGAGGAARGVINALASAGVAEIILANRTRARAETLASGLAGNIRVIDWETRSSVLEGTALLVNTTSLGMQGQDPLDMDLTGLPDTAVVHDIVYVPLETPLLASARAKGCTVVDGLGMLLHQARPGFREWFGVDPQVTQDLRAFVLGGV